MTEQQTEFIVQHAIATSLLCYRDHGRGCLLFDFRAGESIHYASTQSIRSLLQDDPAGAENAIAVIGSYDPGREAYLLALYPGGDQWGSIVTFEQIEEMATMRNIKLASEEDLLGMAI